MAGYDTTCLGKGARRRAQAVGLLAALILCQAWSPAAQAAYRVITKHETVSTGCYHIQDNRLITCSGEHINLRDVVAVDTSALTPRERGAREESLQEFQRRVDALTKEDARIQDLEQRNREVLEYIVGLRSSDKTQSRMDDAIDDAFAMLDQLETAAGDQKLAWKRLTVPEMDLLPLREIKILQYSVRMVSYREWRQYLKQGDSTVREYAREHHRRAGVFEELFQARLARMRTAAAPSSAPAAAVPDDAFWKESEAPEPVVIPKIP